MSMSLRERIGWWLVGAEREYIARNLDDIEECGRLVHEGRAANFTGDRIKANADSIRVYLGLDGVTEIEGEQE